jgi:hypothetical protein
MHSTPSELVRRYQVHCRTISSLIAAPSNWFAHVRFHFYYIVMRLRRIESEWIPGKLSERKVVLVFVCCERKKWSDRKPVNWLSRKSVSIASKMNELFEQERRISRTENGWIDELAPLKTFSNESWFAVHHIEKEWITDPQHHKLETSTWPTTKTNWPCRSDRVDRESVHTISNTLHL